MVISMKLATKLQWTFIGIGGLVAAIAMLSIVNFSRLNHRVGTIYDDRIVPMRQLKNISDNYAVALIDTVNKGHAGMLTKKQVIDKLQEAEDQAQSNWSAYRSTNLTPEETRMATEAGRRLDEMNLQISQIRQLLLSSNDKDVKTILAPFDGPLYGQVDPLTQSLDALIKLQLDVADRERQGAKIIVTQMWMVFVPTLVITLVFLIAVRSLINRSILAALRLMVNQIASASTQIAAASEEEERIAEQEAISINKTTTTMDELNSSAQQSAQQARSAAAGAQRMLTLVHQGSGAVTQTLTLMEQLEAKVQAITEAIDQLTEQITQIDTYQKLVGELASQTNMLALNAAVEAVRAGDHGKGFAVVAAEIRKLADQSKQSADRINRSIDDIRKAIGHSQTATDLGMKTVVQSVDAVQQTATVLEGVLESIDGIAVNSQQISLTAEQQALAITQVLDTMMTLSRAAQETASSISQTKLGIKSLNDTAVNLTSMV